MPRHDTVDPMLHTYTYIDTYAYTCYYHRGSLVFAAYDTTGMLRRSSLDVFDFFL